MALAYKVIFISTLYFVTGIIPDNMFLFFKTALNVKIEI